MKKHIFLGAMLCLMASTPAWAQPKAFVQNVGQITDPELHHRKDIDFKVSQQKGLQVYVGNGSLHYQWIEATAPTDSTTLYDAYRLDMQLIGANPNATISYGKKEATYERYFLSWVNTDNSNEGKVAHYYESVVYHNIYPKIDWKLYFTADGHLEYDFIVHPGGQISDIQIAYKGAEQLEILANGRLYLQTPKGSIEEHAPFSYEAHSKKRIASQFVRKGNTIGFATAPHKGTLVIDPVIEWGTYFGDTGPEAGNDLATDTQGNIYLVGATSSISNIATIGAHQQNYNGGSSTYGADAFISKWDKNGQLFWATYYGGDRVDIAKSVTVLENGKIVMAGQTNSKTHIATTTALQDTLNGTNFDAFVVILDSLGNRLYGTYWGGSAIEGNIAINVTQGDNNSFYITGNTSSGNFPISTNAHRATAQANEGFITLFDANYDVKWSTFFGSTGEDYIVNAEYQNNYLYITGYTNSTDLAMGNSYQNTNNGNNDAFLAQIDTLGLPVWCTYFGGTALERTYAIAVEDTIVAIGGNTRSTSHIADTNAHQNTYFGGVNGFGDDGFLAVFNTNGNKLWSTYYGGDKIEQIKALQIKNKQVYAGLSTNSLNNIATIQSIHTTLQGNNDVGLVKFNTNGQVQWNTYLGGSQSENLNNLIVNDQNEIFITGNTQSGTNIGTPNTHQPNYTNSYDAFIIKINDCDAPLNTASIVGADTVCPNTTVIYSISAITDAVRYHWLLPSGWVGSSDSNTITAQVGTQGGTIHVWAESACGGISDTSLLQIHVHPTRTVSIMLQGSLLRTNAAYAQYQWLLNGVAIPGATNSTYIPTTNGLYSLEVVDEHSCNWVSNTYDMTTLSIHDHNKHYSIYPNPVATTLTITLASQCEVSIYNVIGQKVMQQQLPIGSSTLDLQKLTSGNYVLHITNDEGTYTRLIVKE